MIARARNGAGALLAAGTIVLAAGCGLSRETAPPLAAGVASAQVAGTVARSAQQLSNYKVKLYDDTEGIQMDSTYTSSSGGYGFTGVPAGQWMVKVSPPDPGDLGYVRFFFTLATSAENAAIPPFDVSAHGLTLLAPAAGAVVPRPSFATPLTFTWTDYQAPYLWTSARVSDSLGIAVWSSPQGQGTGANWNGFGNQGAYIGQPAPAGRYRWRVRLRLPNSVQGATAERELTIR